MDVTMEMDFDGFDSGYEDNNDMKVDNNTSSSTPPPSNGSTNKNVESKLNGLTKLNLLFVIKLCEEELENRKINLPVSYNRPPKIDESIDKLKSKTTITRKQLIDETIKLENQLCDTIFFDSVVEEVVSKDSKISSAVLETTSEDEDEEIEAQDPEFALDEKHSKLLDKFIEKTEKYLVELDEDKNTEIDIEAGTLDRFLDTPILNK